MVVVANSCYDGSGDGDSDGGGGGCSGGDGGDGGVTVCCVSLQDQEVLTGSGVAAPAVL